MRKYGLIMFVSLLVFAMPCASVSAHEMPSSQVMLDFQTDSVTAELILPMDRLEIAFGQTLTEDPENVLATYRAELANYIMEHIHPIAADGRNWQVSMLDMSLQLDSQPYDLVAKLRLAPPEGASAETFQLQYDVIVHQLVTHTVLVTVRNDWNNGVFADHEQLIGTIRWSNPSLEINQSGGHWRNGFKNIVALGMSHIAEGTDHLLFLLTLLLPAPLAVRNRRWSEFAGIRHSAVQLGKVATAFTIGHSLTLIAGTLGWIRPNPQFIEVLIAFSILITAVHAFRPLFPGKEGVVAFVFGFVHGLAFAETISDMGLTSWRLAASLFGFNIGMELMQLIVISITVPWLMMLAVTPSFRFVRTVGAFVAAIAAIAWMSERITLAPNRLSSLVDEAAAHAYWLLILLAATASAVTLREWIKRRLQKIPPG